MNKKSINIFISLVLAMAMLISTATIGFADEISDNTGAPAANDTVTTAPDSTQDSDTDNGVADDNTTGQNNDTTAPNTDTVVTDNDATALDNSGEENTETQPPAAEEQIQAGYKLTIKEQDENGNDVLEGTYNGEPIKNVYILVAKQKIETSIGDGSESVANTQVPLLEESDEPAGEGEPAAGDDTPITPTYEYIALDPTADNSTYDVTMIYHFDEDGIGTLYTGSDVITLVYGDITLPLYIKEGKTPVKSEEESVVYLVSGGYLWAIDQNGHPEKYIRDENKHATYYQFVNGILYKVWYDTAEATAPCTRYNGKFYKYGKLITGNPTYVIYEGYVYKITSSGANKKYIKNKKSKKYYYAIVPTVYGNNYLCKIKYKTGKAAPYIKSKYRTDNYTYCTAYTKYWIGYNTGRVNASKGDSEVRQQVVNSALEYLGYSESALNGLSHMIIVSIYNKHRPLPRNYTVKRSDAWCATYVSAMFIQNGLTSIFPKECSCTYQVAKWKKLGRWKESDSYVPKPGDIIYYDWQDSGKGDNKGRPDHVGIVEKVSGGYITVVEGNKADMVCKRVIKVNGRYIRGYGLPHYAKAVKAD